VMLILTNQLHRFMLSVNQMMSSQDVRCASDKIKVSVLGCRREEN
jgi:hypothetical protein